MMGLERLESGGSEEYRVQPECVGGRFRDGEMAPVGGIEGSTKESHAHAAYAITDGQWIYQTRNTSPVVKIFALTDWPVSAL